MCQDGTTLWGVTVRESNIDTVSPPTVRSVEGPSCTRRNFSFQSFYENTRTESQQLEVDSERGWRPLRNRGDTKLTGWILKVGSDGSTRHDPDLGDVQVFPATLMYQLEPEEEGEVASKEAVSTD
jgi:hypothetical protein